MTDWRHMLYREVTPLYMDRLSRGYRTTLRLAERGWWRILSLFRDLSDNMLL